MRQLNRRQATILATGFADELTGSVLPGQTNQGRVTHRRGAMRGDLAATTTIHGPRWQPNASSALTLQW